MAKREKKQSVDTDLIALKLDVILAILLRQLTDDGLKKWNKQDKPSMVRMLIDLGLSNPDISKITGLTYNSVANIRSKVKKRRKKT